MRALAAYWQCELEGCTVVIVIRGPKPSIMGFNDRLTYRQAHAHSALLAGNKSGEQPVRVRRVDPYSYVLDVDEQLIMVMEVGTDPQLAGPIVDLGHGLGSVHHQIDDHLLQLHSVAKYSG